MTDDHTRLLRALLSAVTNLDELPHPRHAGRLLLAAAVEDKGCSDDAVARAASMPVAIARDVLPSMLDRCLHGPALLTARATLKTRSLVRQLAAVDRFAGLISYITGYLVKFSARKLFTSDSCQQPLSLVPGISEAVELVTELVAVEAVPITDVEMIACHAQSGGPG